MMGGGVAVFIVAWMTQTCSGFTFFVSPDTHFTQCGGVPDVAKNDGGISDMNNLPGTAYPTKSQWGGVVDDVRGIIVPGDLVDDGCSPTPRPATNDTGCADQVGHYIERFPLVPAQRGVSGAPSSVRFPVFEGVGNHDGGNSTSQEYGLVRRTVIERNRKRATLALPGLKNYRLSANGLHYSWVWDGVHFVMLGLYPGSAGDCASGEGLPGHGCHPAPWGWNSPEHSLDFLIADLAAVAPETPVVLFMHYGLRGTYAHSCICTHIVCCICMTPVVIFMHYGFRGAHVARIHTDAYAHSCMQVSSSATWLRTSLDLALPLLLYHDPAPQSSYARMPHDHTPHASCPMHMPVRDRLGGRLRGARCSAVAWLLSRFLCVDGAQPSLSSRS